MAHYWQSEGYSSEMWLVVYDPRNPSSTSDQNMFSMHYFIPEPPRYFPFLSSRTANIYTPFWISRKDTLFQTNMVKIYTIFPTKVDCEQWLFPFKDSRARDTRGWRDDGEDGGDNGGDETSQDSRVIEPTMRWLLPYVAEYPLPLSH